MSKKTVLGSLLGLNLDPTDILPPQRGSRPKEFMEPYVPIRPNISLLTDFMYTYLTARWEKMHVEGRKVGRGEDQKAAQPPPAF
jgi:hypothetical protein